jgi:hypothetical protein
MEGWSAMSSKRSIGLLAIERSSPRRLGEEAQEVAEYTLSPSLIFFVVLWATTAQRVRQLAKELEEIKQRPAEAEARYASPSKGV